VTFLFLTDGIRLYNFLQKFKPLIVKVVEIYKLSSANPRDEINEHLLASF